MTGATIREGQRLLEDYGRCSDPWEQVELNRRFHLQLYEPCGKERLVGVEQLAVEEGVEAIVERDDDQSRPFTTRRSGAAAP